MHELTFTAYSESLGKILEQLNASPEAQASPQLAEQVHNARGFHQHLAAEFQGLLREQQMLREQISALTREPGEHVCAPAGQPRFDKYQRLRETGISAPKVYLTAKHDGLDDLSALRALRQVFQLSLREAEEAAAQAEAILQPV